MFYQVGLTSWSNQLRIPRCQVNSIWLDQNYTMEFLQACVHFSVISWVWYKKQWPKTFCNTFVSVLCVLVLLIKWLKLLIVHPWFLSSLGWTNRSKHISPLSQAFIGIIWCKNVSQGSFQMSMRCKTGNLSLKIFCIININFCSQRCVILLD